MNDQKIEKCIDELYALQKHSGERMVEITEQNKWIIEKHERSVRNSVDVIERCCKVLGISVLLACLVGVGTLWWVMHDYKRTLNSGLVVIYGNVEAIKKTNEEIKKLLEENQKSKIGVDSVNKEREHVSQKEGSNPNNKGSKANQLKAKRRYE